MVIGSHWHLDSYVTYIMEGGIARVSLVQGRYDVRQMLSSLLELGIA